MSPHKLGFDFKQSTIRQSLLTLNLRTTAIRDLRVTSYGRKGPAVKDTEQYLTIHCEWKGGLTPPPTQQQIETLFAGSGWRVLSYNFNDTFKTRISLESI